MVSRPEKRAAQYTVRGNSPHPLAVGKTGRLSGPAAASYDSAGHLALHYYGATRWRDAPVWCELVVYADIQPV